MHPLRHEGVRPGWRALALTVAAGCTLALAACGSSSGAGDHAANGSSPAAGGSAAATAPLHSLLPTGLANKGEIVVASDIEYPPFESYASDNTTVVGVDRDLADGFEKLLGVKLEFKNSAFDAIIPGLASKRYDMAMSAMSDTPDREKQVDFVDYLKAGGGIMVPAANPKNIGTLDDLCGLKVGIDKGTTEVQDGQAQSKKCSSEGKAPLDISIYPGQNQMVLALQSGRADAIMMDSTAGGYVADQAHGAFKMLAPYQAGYFGIVFPKGDTQLEQAFQKALEQMSQSGSYQKILSKYGQGGGAIDNFTINGGVAQ